MNARLRGLVLAFLPLALTLPAGPAFAVGTGEPSLTSPTEIVKSGYTGPVTVDFSDAPTDDYTLDLSCGSSYYEWTDFNYDGSQDTYNWTVPAIKGPKNCELEIYGYDADVIENFSVAAPPLPAMDVSNVTLNRSRFYPTVRDGYEDSTTARFRLNQKAHVVATVTNSAGTRVRRVDLHSRSKGSHSWSWNGRKNDGKPVHTGTYAIAITGTNADGRIDRATHRVTAASAVVTKKTTVRHWGDSGRAATSGSCQVSRDHYEGTMSLDCWGGNYAQASYVFALPHNAYNVTWRMSGQWSGADICCDGRLTKSGSRVSSKRFRITAKVTGWRAWDVWSSRVTYSYKKRI